jgi:hypothetical protein
MRKRMKKINLKGKPAGNHKSKFKRKRRIETKIGIQPTIENIMGFGGGRPRVYWLEDDKNNILQPQRNR